MTLTVMIILEFMRAVNGLLILAAAMDLLGMSARVLGWSV